MKSILNILSPDVVKSGLLKADKKQGKNVFFSDLFNQDDHNNIIQISTDKKKKHALLHMLTGNEKGGIHTDTILSNISQGLPTVLLRQQTKYSKKFLQNSLQSQGSNPGNKIQIDPEGQANIKNKVEDKTGTRIAGSNNSKINTPIVVTKKLTSNVVSNTSNTIETHRNLLKKEVDHSFPLKEGGQLTERTAEKNLQENSALISKHITDSVPKGKIKNNHHQNMMQQPLDKINSKKSENVNNDNNKSSVNLKVYKKINAEILPVSKNTNVQQPVKELVKTSQRTISPIKENSQIASSRLMSQANADPKIKTVKNFSAPIEESVKANSKVVRVKEAKVSEKTKLFINKNSDQTDNTIKNNSANSESNKRINTEKLSVSKYVDVQKSVKLIFESPQKRSTVIKENFRSASTRVNYQPNIMLKDNPLTNIDDSKIIRSNDPSKLNHVNNSNRSKPAVKSTPENGQLLTNNFEPSGKARHSVTEQLNGEMRKENDKISHKPNPALEQNFAEKLVPNTQKDSDVKKHEEQSNNLNVSQRNNSRPTMKNVQSFFDIQKMTTGANKSNNNPPIVKMASIQSKINDTGNKSVAKFHLPDSEIKFIEQAPDSKTGFVKNAYTDFKFDDIKNTDISKLVSADHRPVGIWTNLANNIYHVQTEMTPLFTSSGTSASASTLTAIHQMVQFIYTSRSGKELKASFKVDGGKLGMIKIQFEKDIDGDSARILVSTEVSRSHIQKMVPFIQNELIEKGITLNSLDIELDNSEEKGNRNKFYPSEENSQSYGLNKCEIEEDIHITHKLRDFGYNTFEIVA